MLECADLLNSTFSQISPQSPSFGFHLTSSRAYRIGFLYLPWAKQNSWFSPVKPVPSPTFPLLSNWSLHFFKQTPPLPYTHSSSPSASPVSSTSEPYLQSLHFSLFPWPHPLPKPPSLFSCATAIASSLASLLLFIPHHGKSSLCSGASDLKKKIRSCHAPTSDPLWLPTALGIKSRFLTMAYKILRDMAPASSVVCYHCLLCQIPSLLASVWFLRYAVIFHLSLCLWCSFSLECSSVAFAVAHFCSSRSQPRHSSSILPKVVSPRYPSWQRLWQPMPHL